MFCLIKPPAALVPNPKSLALGTFTCLCFAIQHHHHTTRAQIEKCDIVELKTDCCLVLIDLTCLKHICDVSRRDVLEQPARTRRRSAETFVAERKARY